MELKRLQDADLHLKSSKGHRIDSEGISPIIEKVYVIPESATQNNASEGRNYLALFYYHHRCLKNISTAEPNIQIKKTTNCPWK